MKDKSQKDLLIDTLVQAGVPLSDAGKVEIIDCAPDNPTENSRVHAKTNATIFELLQKNELGKCVHVTGGARALTDPYHRQMCEAMRSKHIEPFQVLCYKPNNVKEESWGLVDWNLRRWVKKGFSDWRQKLLTLNMIGTQSVDLKSYDERNKIQYSVFGNRYVQVQGEHEDSALAKYVWLIKSDNVNSWLTEFAEKDLQNAAEIDERCFKDFVSALFTNTARIMLYKIMEGKVSTRDQLLADENISFIDPDASGKLAALQVMGFVNEDAIGHLAITSDGRSFLREQE
ncbi:hypothetical protein [Methylocaldum sp. 14B]|uniref:hypothetical protein n=1 Tax=Methylocaldum sp. 14B TaxID=1912213 RepID=UPI00098AC860|nr:hypothetical protein [Methylocaldum sp. 14B]